nr:uncharacterized protein LOC103235266 isoform X3 [Chlorocebus sabaeus]
MWKPWGENDKERGHFSELRATCFHPGLGYKLSSLLQGPVTVSQAHGTLSAQHSSGQHPGSLFCREVCERSHRAGSVTSAPLRRSTLRLLSATPCPDISSLPGFSLTSSTQPRAGFFQKEPCCQG